MAYVWAWTPDDAGTAPFAIMAGVMSETRTPGDEQAHDVLAAEAFAMPGSDPSLHHRPLVVPGDPAGIEEPHDVLAAEEFPMPALRPHGSAAEISARRKASRVRWAVSAGLLALLVIRARRRH